ncbi:MAG: hypothetical protein C4320_04555 [Armatimonadota bacterium]
MMSEMDGKLRETLRRCLASREMVEIYADPEDLVEFNVGMVESVGHNSYCIQSIDPYGQFDGRQIGRIDEIVRLVTGSEYLAAIRLLHDGRDALVNHPMPSTEPYGEMDFENSLRFAQENRLLVSLIDRDREAIMGFVTDYGREFVEIREVRRDGHEDGTFILALDDVSRVDVGGRNERARQFLHRVRMGL